jgi:hypothetical protein
MLCEWGKDSLSKALNVHCDREAQVTIRNKVTGTKAHVCDYHAGKAQSGIIRGIVWEREEGIK